MKKTADDPALQARECRWLRALRRGDFEVFDHVFRRHSRRIYAFLYRLTWRADLAEAITHEVFTELWKGAMVCDPRSRLSFLLYRAATRLYLESLDADGLPPGSVDVMRGQNPSLFSSAKDSIASFTKKLRSVRRESEQDIDARATRKSTASISELGRTAIEREIRQALFRLSPMERIVFVLLIYQGLPFDRIAAILELPLADVQRISCRADLKLRDLLLAERKTPTDRPIERTDDFTLEAPDSTTRVNAEEVVATTEKLTMGEARISSREKSRKDSDLSQDKSEESES